MSKNHVAAPSSSIGAIALALVVALELTGVYALAQGPGQLEAVANADGATVHAPAKARVASVEISIVAQADTPAH